MLLLSGTLWAQPQGKEILDRIDANMSADTRYVKSKMVIHGPRSSRTIESESWAEGKSAFTEYLAPAREKGHQNAQTGRQTLDLLPFYGPNHTDLRTYASPVCYGI